MSHIYHIVDPGLCVVIISWERFVSLITRTLNAPYKNREYLLICRVFFSNKLSAKDNDNPSTVQFNVLDLQVSITLLNNKPRISASMDAAPFVEVVHAGWAFIKDDKVLLYTTQTDSTSTGDGIPVGRLVINMEQRVPGVEEDHHPHHPSLVIDNLQDPSALLDPEMEAAIRTKGVYVGYARIEDNDLPLYLMPQGFNGADEVAAEHGDEDETPDSISDKQDEHLIPLKTDSNNNPGAQEASLGSFEERILQALGGFEMLTIREAYLEASRFHANTIGALPTVDCPFIGRISRAANYCGAVLKSFRRQMLNGIDHGMVTTMLLHLRIVVNILGQVFPTNKDKVDGKTDSPSHPITKGKHHEASAPNGREVVNDRALNVVPHDESGKREIQASQNLPVELDAEFDGAGTPSVHNAKKLQALSGYGVEATAKTRTADNDSDEWSWEDMAEADDFAEVIGWEIL